VYTRGLAASADFVLLGESERAPRASRRHSMSGLWLLDRNTWQALDYICLGSYGGVHEVRLLNIKDEAHHGHLFAGIDALLTRGRQEDLTAERLSASTRARRSKAMWKSFELIFGSPVPADNGGQSADSETLCLLIQRAQDQPGGTLSFSYSIGHQEEESHMAIVAYRGQGGDSDMDALLLRRISQRDAQMSSWSHDGRSWTRRADIAIDGLPLSGDVQFKVTHEGVKLEINGQQVSGDCLDYFPIDSGALGIRWLGATIWPAKE